MGPETPTGSHVSAVNYFYKSARKRHESTGGRSLRGAILFSACMAGYNTVDYKRLSTVEMRGLAWMIQANRDALVESDTPRSLTSELS